MKRSAEEREGSGEKKRDEEERGKNGERVTKER